MARTSIRKTASSYYPPRARWYSPIFNLGDAIRRRLWLNRIHIQIPRGMTVTGSAASFLVPGLGIYFRHPIFWGRVVIVVCGLLLLCFIVWFGYPAGNFAFGLLLAIHATGFVYYCSPLLRQAELSSRLYLTLFALLAIGLLVYLPMRNLILQHWVLPLGINGRVFVVRKQFPVTAIQRGDWIAYKLGSGGNEWERGWGHGTVRVRSGLGLGPVLAMAGDRVGFSTNGFTVNGTPHPFLPHMPQYGEVTVPEKHWFIWPELGISGHGNTPEDSIAATMLRLALVSEDDFVGKLFQRWLWRRQIIP